MIVTIIYVKGIGSNGNGTAIIVNRNHNAKKNNNTRYYKNISRIHLTYSLIVITGKIKLYLLILFIFHLDITRGAETIKPAVVNGKGIENSGIGYSVPRLAH